jgi:hypothetical protein
VITRFFLSALINQHQMSSLKPLLAALLLMALGLLIANYLERLPPKPRPLPDNEHTSIVEAVLMASDTLSRHNPRPPPSSFQRFMSPLRQTPPRTPRSFHAKTSTFRKRLTKSQKQLVLHRFGWRYAGCHKPLHEPWDTQFDHVVPLAAASTDPAFIRTWQLNHVHAFQPLCRRCHGYKRHKERQAGLYTRHLV